MSAHPSKRVSYSLAPSLVAWEHMSIAEEDGSLHSSNGKGTPRIIKALHLLDESIKPAPTPCIGYLPIDRDGERAQEGSVTIVAVRLPVVCRCKVKNRKSSCPVPEASHLTHSTRMKSRSSCCRPGSSQRGTSIHLFPSSCFLIRLRRRRRRHHHRRFTD